MPPAARTDAVSTSGSGAAAKPAREAAAASTPTPVFHPPLVTAQQVVAEDSKLRRVEESIRVFVRVADPKFRQVVPMRYFNLILSTSEVDAFCATYLEEKSLRAELGSTLIRLVSISARIRTELEELKRSQSMSSLWKLHADSLVVLLDIAGNAVEDAGGVGEQAQTTGAGVASKALHESVKKVTQASELAVSVLARVG
jgi:hypothetical protein